MFANSLIKMFSMLGHFQKLCVIVEYLYTVTCLPENNYVLKLHLCFQTKFLEMYVSVFCVQSFPEFLALHYTFHSWPIRTYCRLWTGKNDTYDVLSENWFWHYKNFFKKRNFTFHIWHDPDKYLSHVCLRTNHNINQ